MFNMDKARCSDPIYKLSIIWDSVERKYKLVGYSGWYARMHVDGAVLFFDSLEEVLDYIKNINN